MTQVVLAGRAYSDDRSSARDFNDGGAKTWLFPMMADLLTEVDSAVGAALSAEQSAVVAGSLASSLSGTSVTALDIAPGMRSLQTQPGKFFGAGTFLALLHGADPSVFMYGRVVTYDAVTGALTVNVLRYEGAGNFNDWIVRVTGVEGVKADAAPPALRHRSINAAASLTAADVFRLIHLSGTFALTLDSVANLGSSFSVFLRNESNGVVTLTPSAGNLIDDRSSRKLWPGEVILLACDGVKLTAIVLSRGSSGVLHLQNRNGPQSLLNNAYTTVAQSTTVVNTLEGASVASGVISLPAGEYRIRWSAMYTGGGSAKVSLYNNTSSSTLAIGSGGVSGSLLVLEAPFTLTTPANVIVRAFCTVSVGSLGYSVGDGNPDVASNAIIERVA